MKRELIATATFGLEAVVRREIEALGYEVLRTEDGKVTYSADERGIVRSNLWLRCADRVLLKVAEFQAPEFEDLFQQTKAIAWEEIIPMDGAFVVTCTTVKSKLHNEPACQRTVKKAIALRLQEFYVQERMPETGAAYTVKLTLLKDRATLTIDTSGAGLHKRGYRVSDVAAPIKETLAAALVQLSFWKRGRLLVDPCCGSGTIPIEAAMIGCNIAPGLSRNFASEGWDIIDPKIWKEERQKAFAAIRMDAETDAATDAETDAEADAATDRIADAPGEMRPDSAAAPVLIYASDIDKRAVRAARENAEEAGVEEVIRFAKADVARLDAPAEDAVIVTNLPYGVRIGSTPEIDRIYEILREKLAEHPGWSLFAITPDKTIEEKMQRRADRRRKLYNGNIETTYYQFHGKRRKR